LSLLCRSKTDHALVEKSGIFFYYDSRSGVSRSAFIDVLRGQILKIYCFCPYPPISCGNGCFIENRREKKDHLCTFYFVVCLFDDVPVPYTGHIRNIHSHFTPSSRRGEIFAKLGSYEKKEKL
jgi:hypothetical protein